MKYTDLVFSWCVFIILEHFKKLLVFCTFSATVCVFDKLKKYFLYLLEDQRLGGVYNTEHRIRNELVVYLSAT